MENEMSRYFGDISYFFANEAIINSYEANTSYSHTPPMRNDWKPSDAPRSFGILYDETHETLGIPKPEPVSREKTTDAELPVIPVIGECTPSPFSHPDGESIIWATTCRDAVTVALIAKEISRRPKE